MSFKPTVLLITRDKRQARQVAAALERRFLPSPIHAPDGESAVAWLTSHGCDVCVLDYDLPGIDGLETALRLHQRAPNLPIIMISNARSEKVAVAAFRAGVVDYIPKADFRPDVIGERVQQFAQVTEQDAASSLGPAPTDWTDQLRRPTYENRLRVIGRQLDLYSYHTINLSEISGGMLVRALQPNSRTAIGLEFADRDFPQLVSGAIAARGSGRHQCSSSPLHPTGYEDLLRAVGHTLDKRRAEAVTITELENFVAVGGTALVDGWQESRAEPFQDLLRSHDIVVLLESAQQRRAQATEPFILARLTSGMQRLRA